FYRQALEIRRRVLGEEHPDTANSYHNAAAGLRDQGEYAQAEPLFEQALDVRRRLLGETHPDTANSYAQLANNRYAQGKYADAIDLWSKAAAAYEAARLGAHASGLDRAAFGEVPSPLPRLAACLARTDRPSDAWQRLEQYLARGLLDEATARRLPTRTAAERQ